MEPGGPCTRVPMVSSWCPVGFCCAVNFFYCILHLYNVLPYVMNIMRSICSFSIWLTIAHLACDQYMPSMAHAQCLPEIKIHPSETEDW